eukprot:2140522-Rhodomonas_salina.1
MRNRGVGKWLRNEALPSCFQKQGNEMWAFAAPPTRTSGRGTLGCAEARRSTLEQALVRRMN